MEKKVQQRGITKNDMQKTAMLEALTNSLGVVSTAAGVVGIARETHYRWLKEDPDYKLAVESLADISIDFAESMLHKRMKEGSDAAIIFFLKCRGKHRGYIEKNDVEHSGEIRITVKEQLMS